jgi:hypothetical protein
MHNTENITKLAEAITASGNTRGNRLMRIAQAIENYSSEDEFNEAGDVPHIESFIKKESEPEKHIQVHNATVAFAAPHGVSEADIMEYILGIGDALGVKVESFKWSVQDSKKRQE